MGRPKSDAENATVRLEKAFWNMLSHMSYTDITVMALARQANVNHNTIYYHFGSIDDMAAAFVKRTLSPETSEQFICMVAGEEGSNKPMDVSLFTGFTRVRLLAASESPYLRKLTQNRILEAWLAHFGVTEEDLTPEEQIDIRFAFAGIFDLLGDRDLVDLPQQLSGFMSRDIGAGIRKTIARITAAHK